MKAFPYPQLQPAATWDHIQLFPAYYPTPLKENTLGVRGKCDSNSSEEEEVPSLLPWRLFHLISFFTSPSTPVNAIEIFHSTRVYNFSPEWATVVLPPLPLSPFPAFQGSDLICFVFYGILETIQDLSCLSFPSAWLCFLEICFWTIP